MKLRVRWEPPKSELSYPIGRAPRTAVLVSWFRPAGDVRIFRGGWSIDAAAYAPHSIAATWTQFEELMSREIVSPERSILVLARPGDALLTEVQRDCLWRAFQVPIFEQIVGKRGNVVAGECEAHAGLHTMAEDSLNDAYLLDRRPCACGKTSPRILRKEVAEPVRAAAAAR